MTLQERNRWTTGLRSGAYKQGTGELKQVWMGEVVYCCLGVFCDVVRPFGGGWTNRDEQSRIERTYVYDDQRSAHGRAYVTLHAPMDSINEELMSQLVNLNDVERYSFAQIADWIELNVPVDDVEVGEVRL